MLSAFLPLLLAVREPDDLSITQRRSPADTRKFLKQQLFNTIGSPAALESMVVQSDECWAVMVMDGNAYGDVWASGNELGDLFLQAHPEGLHLGVAQASDLPSLRLPVGNLEYPGIFVFTTLQSPNATFVSMKRSFGYPESYFFTDIELRNDLNVALLRQRWWDRKYWKSAARDDNPPPVIFGGVITAVPPPSGPIYFHAEPAYVAPPPPEMPEAIREEYCAMAHEDENGNPGYVPQPCRGYTAERLQQLRAQARSGGDGRLRRPYDKGYEEASASGIRVESSPSASSG